VTVRCFTGWDGRVDRRRERERERGGIDTDTHRERRTFRADWPRAEYFSIASCTAALSESLNRVMRMIRDIVAGGIVGVVGVVRL
jgi:hypothetical protein